MKEVNKMKDIYTIEEIKNNLNQIFTNVPDITKAILFGSYAKNKATTNSDGSITITATPRNDFMSFVSQFSYIQKRINICYNCYVYLAVN